MATLGQIKTKVQNLVLHANTAVVAVIQDYVQQAQIIFEDAKGLSTLEKSKTYTTIDGVGLLSPIPTDFVGEREPLAIINKSKDLSSLTQITRLQIVDHHELGSAIKGKPSEYNLDTLTGNILLYPPPNVPSDGGYLNLGKYTFLYYYWGRETTLSSNEDTNWFTDNAQYALIWEAAAMALEFNRDPLATYYYNKAKMERRRIKRTDKRKKYGGSFAVAPIRNAIGSR